MESTFLASVLEGYWELYSMDLSLFVSSCPNLFLEAFVNLSTFDFIWKNVKGLCGTQTSCFLSYK